MTGGVMNNNVDNDDNDADNNDEDDDKRWRTDKDAAPVPQHEAMYINYCYQRLYLLAYNTVAAVVQKVTVKAIKAKKLLKHLLILVSRLLRCFGRFPFLCP